MALSKTVPSATYQFGVQQINAFFSPAGVRGTGGLVMKKLLIALTMAGAAVTTAPASAAVYNFTTTPVDGSVFSGSFDISGPAGSRTLNAFSGSFMGFTYGLSDVGLTNFGSDINIGGNLNGTGRLRRDTNDFFTNYFTLSPTSTTVGLISDTSGVLAPLNFTITQTAAGVPEPATWTLMILGMGAVGFAMRRRKNVNMTVRFA